MKRWIRSNWFLLALAGVFISGHFGAEMLSPLAKQSGLRSAVVMLVMWVMGITLRGDAIGKCFNKPTGSLIAIGSNLFLVPILCLAGMWFLSPEMGGGLFVAGLVPCTLASASVWTRKAKGDDSIAIMTTMVTNLGCIIVVPLGVQVVLALQARVPPLVQMEKLVWFVVLPLIVAQLMRRFGSADWADRNKHRLSAVAQIGILLMVLFGAVAGSGYGSDADLVGVWTIVSVVAIALTVHLIAMALAIFVARRAGLSRAQQIAVGISGSQKTLMIGLQIAIDCGVSVVPMLVYHAGQLVADTLIADRWRRGRGEKMR